VWVGQETTSLAARRQLYGDRKIRMFVENWDRDYLQDQENVIGRAKVSGPVRRADSPRPTSPRLGRREPAIPADAHIRLASPSTTRNPISCAAATPSPTASTEAGTLLGRLVLIAFMKTRPSSSSPDGVAGPTP